MSQRIGSHNSTCSAPGEKICLWFHCTHCLLRWAGSDRQRMPASGAAVGRLGGASPRHGAQNGPCSEGGHLPPSKLGCARSGRARVYRGLHDGRVDPATGLNQRRSSSRSAPNSLRPTQRQCAISAYAAAEKPVAAPPPAVCAPRRVRPRPHDFLMSGRTTGWGKAKSGKARHVRFTT